MSRFEADIDIEIDRLVLRGMEMTPGRAEQLRDAMEKQLEQIFLEEGGIDLEGNQNRGLLAGSAVRVSSLEDVDGLANELAETIRNALKRSN
mgnify:CR=1 FL=1